MSRLDIVYIDKYLSVNIVKHVKDKFADRANRPANTKRSPLQIYCDQLIQSVKRGGYGVVHSRDLLQYIEEKNGIKNNSRRPHVKFKLRDSDPPVYAHIYKMLHALKLDRSFWYFIKPVYDNVGGFAVRSLKIIGLPDETGLIERVAPLYGMNPRKIQQTGLRDQHLYAQNVIHEAGHVMGNDGFDWTTKSYLPGEFENYALETIRFLRASEFHYTHPAAQLLRDMHTLYNIFIGLRNQELYPYVTSEDAIEWVADRMHLPDIWDEDRNGFKPEAYKALAGLAPVPSLDLKGDFHRARTALDRYVEILGESLPDNIRFNLDLRDAALKAARDLVLQDDERSGLILRKLAFAADTVARCSDGYKPMDARYKPAAPRPPQRG